MTTLWISSLVSLCLLVTAGAASHEVVKNTKRLQLGLDSDAKIASSAGGDLLVVTDPSQTFFAFSGCGDLLWSFPGYPDASLSHLYIIDGGDDSSSSSLTSEGMNNTTSSLLVIAHFTATIASIESGRLKHSQVVAINGTTGLKQWSFDTPQMDVSIYGESYMSFSQTFFTFNPNNSSEPPSQESFLVNYDLLKSGQMLWNVSLGAQQQQDVSIVMSGSFGSNTVVLTVIRKGGYSGFLTLDLKSGRFLCELRNVLIPLSGAPTVAGELFVVPLQHMGSYGIYNTSTSSSSSSSPARDDVLTSCQEINQFTGNETSGGRDKTVEIRSVGDSLYILSKGGEFYGLTKLGGDGNSYPWRNTEFSPDQRYFHLGASPFERKGSSRGLVVNIGGNFTGIGSASGSERWSLAGYPASQNLPYAAPSSAGSGGSGQQLYPAGNGFYFIPNLQGYILTQGLGNMGHVELQNPVHGTSSVFCRNNNAAGSGSSTPIQAPWVVFVEVVSGDLVWISYH